MVSIRIHPQIVHRVNLVNVDDVISVQRPEVNDLSRQSEEFAHPNIGVAYQVDVLQRTSAQLEQLEREEVFF